MSCRMCAWRFVPWRVSRNRCTSRRSRGWTRCCSAQTWHATIACFHRFRFRHTSRVANASTAGSSMWTRTAILVMRRSRRIERLGDALVIRHGRRQSRRLEGTNEVAGAGIELGGKGVKISRTLSDLDRVPASFLRPQNNKLGPLEGPNCLGEMG